MEVLVIHRDLFEENAEGGSIDWTGFSRESIQLLNPGESLFEEVSTPSVFDGHYILVSYQGDSGSGEARVIVEYIDGGLLWSAILCSLPSFAITGWVIAELSSSEDEVSKQASDVKA